MRALARRPFGALLTVAVAAPLLAACNPDHGSEIVAERSAPTTELPRSGGALVFGLEGHPNGLNPTKSAFDTAGLQVSNALFDPLVAMAADGSPQPYLAARLDHDADYTRWTIRLRPDVYFHDGTPVTATEVAGFLDAMRTAVGLSAVVSAVKGYTVVDRLTVQVDTRMPWATYPMILTGQGGMIAAPRQLTDEKEGAIRPVGTGPFRLRSWELGKEIRLERNERYWRRDPFGKRLPYLDSVRFRADNEVSGRITQLRTGEYDVIHVHSSADVLELQQAVDAQQVQVEADPGPSETLFVTLNTGKAPMDDVRVRRAVALATDREALRQSHGWMPDRLTRTAFPEVRPFLADDVGVPAFDLDAARRLVDDYVDERGARPRIVLKTGADLPLAQQLADMWSRAGLRVQVEAIDNRQRTIMALAGQYDAILLQYFGSRDPDHLWHFWHSSTYAPPGTLGINLSRLRDARVDEGIDRARATADPEGRRRAYRQVQERFAELVPYVALVRTRWSIASRATVRNARNVTLPEGGPASPFDAGVFRLTETWLHP